MATLKILTVVGARPQFVKAAALSQAILEWNESHPDRTFQEDIIHTGQHYDPGMSQVFFDEMKIPPPAVNLEVGSGTHGAMTGRMLEGLEAEMLTRKPDWVLVYGDTNSTLAAAIAASKLHIPVAHVEAGLRSFKLAMPEEINRVLTDHVSKLLLVPTHVATQNLKKEGITDGVIHTGDVMHDCARIFGEVAERISNALQEFELEPNGYALATVHRAENTDSKERLEAIFRGLGEVSQTLPVVLPLHPRTAAKIKEHQLGELLKPLRILDPVGFIDMVRLEQGARLILTDSGGVQKEAYFHRVPCVTMRDETEWVETVESGWNTLVGADQEKIVRAAAEAKPGKPIPEYGDGFAGTKILQEIANASE